MNRKPAQTYIFLATVLISVLMTGLYFSPRTEESSTETPLWILREYNGSPAVFKENEDKPCEILDIKISALPSEDRKMLTEGIRISSEDELFRLIEDYSS